jgi:hypothetical protein
MAKARHRKGHKQKAAVRKQKIQESKNRMKKIQEDFIKQIIANEQNSGKFDNVQNIDDVIVEGPEL